jgi:endoglucanase
MKGARWWWGAAAGLVLAGVLATWQLNTSGERGRRLDLRSWQAYESRFITEDGRVVDRDTVATGITHSEGQGYGMLLAEAAGDRQRFAQLWDWTRDHLRRPDGLFSWSFGACPDGKGGCVTDTNNASDGDILIAWALLRAGKDWNRPDYRDASRAIAEVLADRQIKRLGGFYLLLPGSQGFTSGDAVVVNLSYWIFPALRDFGAAFQQPAWQALTDSGYELLRQARFGKWGLPPDWLQVGGGDLKPAPGFPPRYGFNAVRVPLHLAWVGRAPLDLQEPFRNFWRAPHPQGVPAWADLTSDAVAPYAWSAGVQAIGVMAGGDGGPMPNPAADDGYFSWSLALLAQIAAAESPR